jgi:hypothetical protein
MAELQSPLSMTATQLSLGPDNNIIIIIVVFRSFLVLTVCLRDFFNVAAGVELFTVLVVWGCITFG